MLLSIANTARPNKGARPGSILVQHFHAGVRSKTKKRGGGLKSGGHVSAGQLSERRITSNVKF